MSKAILEALSQLDTDNNDHWTADGAPRMDVVEQILGENVSRADVTKAAPKFSRANPVVNVDEIKPADLAPGANPDPFAGGDDDKTDGLGNGSEPTDGELVIPEQEEPVKVTIGSEEADAIEAEHAAATKNFAEAKARLVAADEQMDRLILFRQDTQSEDFSTTVQRYQQQQIREARKRHGNLEAVKQLAKSLGLEIKDQVL